MGLRVLLFVTVFMLSDAASVKIQAYFNSTAHLPCQPTKPLNKTLSELIVFWQNQKTLVLYEFYMGKEKLDNVNANFLGRTSFDRDNWALLLHNVQIKDMGSYECYIQHKTPKGSVILHQSDTELSVIANFSEPEIQQDQNVTRNSGINLTCSSKQGYPKPTRMYFWITNSTNKHGDDPQISQDNVTELFSISVSLYLPFPDGAHNMTAVCVLETGSMNISSRSHNIAPPESQSVPEKRKLWTVVAIILIISFVILGLFLLVRSCLKKLKKKRKWRGGERDRGKSENLCA